VRWRLLHSEPLDGPLNMALDHALMERARRTGESVLRVYSWASPVLSLGRNQRARDAYDELRLTQRGISVVRRPTGGRALLHHREITYSVTAPVAGLALAAAYRRVNALLLDALSSLGVPASVASPTARSRPPTALPCFAEPATGEIIVNGRKLAGSAQWRDDGALLQHGSIIVDDDQQTIPLLMREPPDPSPPPATLREALGRAPTSEELADRLFTSVRSMEDPAATALEQDEIESLDTQTFLSLYRDPEWTWRR
jgi:lipoyl(octanoyl) transferase